MTSKIFLSCVFLLLMGCQYFSRNTRETPSCPTDFPSAQCSGAQYIENQYTVKSLQVLIQYEIDNLFLIKQCFYNLKNKDLRDFISNMKGDCRQNIKELSFLLRQYKEEVLTDEKDFKGFFMEGYAAMRGGFTDQGALTALHTNQQFILRAFETALESTLPEDVKSTLKIIIERKKANIKYLESKLS